MVGLGDNGYGSASMAILFLDRSKSPAKSYLSPQMVQRKLARLSKGQKGILAFYLMSFLSKLGSFCRESKKQGWEAYNSENH